MTKAKGKKAAAPKRVRATDAGLTRVLVLGSVGGASGSVHAAGAVPVELPPRGDAAVAAVANVDAVLLTGGGDVSPELYGAKRHRSTYGTNDDRDLCEVLVLEAALKRGIPVMGICRGMQVMNVAFGGTLHQNIGDLKGTHAFHRNGEHRVRVADGSRLAAAWGTDEPQWVTSYHHQAVNKVAAGFVATGWALDGTIEAMEAVEGWMLGVQFHPEMRYDVASQAIFNRFVAAAADNAGKPAPVPVPVTWMVPPTSNQDYTHPANKSAKASAKVITSGRPTPKRRGAPKPRRSVTTRWRCFRCGIPDFDFRTDYVDHMLILHEVELWDLDDDMDEDQYDHRADDGSAMMSKKGRTR